MLINFYATLYCILVEILYYKVFRKTNDDIFTHKNFWNLEYIICELIGNEN